MSFFLSDLSPVSYMSNRVSAESVPPEVLKLKEARGRLEATDCTSFYTRLTFFNGVHPQICDLAINLREYDWDSSGQAFLVGKAKCVSSPVLALSCVATHPVFLMTVGPTPMLRRDITRSCSRSIVLGPLIESNRCHDEVCIFTYLASGGLTSFSP